jgi:hypothetical protein
MNLEQIVKETVAKMVDEKHLTAAETKKKEDIVMAMKKDFKGPEAALYAIATDKAKKLAEDGLNEDYEVAMAQDSLDSIIRAAMMLKAQMGDQEVNLPAWIQDHITNSENYINQAAKGYHESDTQMDDEAGAKEMNEANLDENKMDKEELKQAQIDKAYDHLEKMKENTKLFSKEDIKKAEARIEKLEAELDALADKSVNESLDEFTVRRWQHYAGIK